MICRFCGNDRKLIKAHIIPEGFFRRLRRGPGSLKLISGKVGEYQKDRPIGVYDKGIVCENCESVWKTWDEYAQLLLADGPLNTETRSQDGKPIAHLVKHFDYDKLKLFFISLLWRASVSTDPFFAGIVLGPFEEVARKHISCRDPGDSEDFAVVLAKFDDPLAKVILNPHEELFEEVRYCRFYLADYVAYIKVDTKPCAGLFSRVVLSRSRPLVIVCRDFRESSELPLIKKMVGG